MYIICVNKNYGDKTYLGPYLNILTGAVTRKKSSKAIHMLPPCARLRCLNRSYLSDSRYPRHHLSRM